MTESAAPTPSRNQILEDAWTRYAKYDKNALLAQKRFIQQRKWILALTVTATTLAVCYSFLETQIDPSAVVFAPWLTYKILLEGFHGLVVLTPIVLSIMVAGSVKFNLGISWLMLRSSAETLKKEIYSFRTRTGEYSPAETESESREVKMARKLKIVSKRLMETQVNQTGLEPYKGNLPPLYGTAEGDDGFSDMSADQYLHWRVEDQFNYYQKKAVRLSRELQRFQWFIYILGGLGTLLAAFGFDIWIAVSSALAGALTSFLEFKRVETTLVSCNIAAADLYDIRAWWHALTTEEKLDQASAETLVSSAEAVLQTENAGWLQEMRDALSEIYGQKKEEADKAKEADAGQASPRPGVAGAEAETGGVAGTLAATEVGSESVTPTVETASEPELTTPANPSESEPSIASEVLSPT